MVPFKPLGIEQEANTQDKTLTLMRRREAFQPVINFSIFINQRWFIKITGLQIESTSQATLILTPNSTLPCKPVLITALASLVFCNNVLGHFSLKPFFSVHFLRRRFSYTSSFIHFISRASIPPNSARHLYTLAELIPFPEHKSGTLPLLRSTLRWP